MKNHALPIVWSILVAGISFLLSGAVVTALATRDSGRVVESLGDEQTSGANFLTLYGRPVEKITPSEFAQSRDNDNPLIVDVREPARYKVSRVRGAINAPKGVFSLEKASYAPLNTYRHVLVYCRYDSECENQANLYGVITQCESSAQQIQNALPKSKVMLLAGTKEDIEKHGIELDTIAGRW